MALACDEGERGPSAGRESDRLVRTLSIDQNEDVLVGGVGRLGERLGRFGRETGYFPGVGYGLLAMAGPSPPSLIKEAAVATTAAVEWKIKVIRSSASARPRASKCAGLSKARTCSCRSGPRISTASSEIGCEPSFESLTRQSLRCSAQSRRSCAPPDPSEVTSLPTMAATLVAAWRSPMTSTASSQALGLMPSIERTSAAVATKSRQLTISPLA